MILNRSLLYAKIQRLEAEVSELEAKSNRINKALQGRKAKLHRLYGYLHESKLTSAPQDHGNKR